MRLEINSFWMCWTGMGQQVAQLHDSYMTVVVMMMMMMIGFPQF